MWYKSTGKVQMAGTYIYHTREERCNGRVRFILDSWLTCKLFLIPKINDFLLKLERFQYATSLDLKKGYYHIGLRHKRSAQLSSGASKFYYKQCLWGTSFRRKCQIYFPDWEFALLYLDNVLVLTTGMWNDHLHKLDLTLWIAKAGQKSMQLISPLENKRFRYWISRHGIKRLVKNKVEAIHAYCTLFKNDHNRR